MAYWIFKVAKQALYPDVPGEKYVYDNTHSVRVAEGDVFLYLDKRKGYSFTATGGVRTLTKRMPTSKEISRTSKVRTVFTAHLQDVIIFKQPLTISPSTLQGRQNRARLGIEDANQLGWSQSMASINEAMYQNILDLAEVENLVPSSPGNEDFLIPDKWSKTKVRSALKKFSGPIFSRSNSKCVVCGTALYGIVEAAHLSPYASDQNNRANPANGICLCKFCHRAFDLRLIAITLDGRLLVSPSVEDPVALHHFSQIDATQRVQWIKGVDSQFLEQTIRWFKENLPNK